MRSVVTALVSFGLVLTGCGDDDGGRDGGGADAGRADAAPGDAGADGGGHVDDSGAEDGGVTDAGSGCRASFAVPAGDGDVCVGAAVDRVFRHAVCACDGITVTALSTDAFDSRDGPYTPGESGGAVGANGDMINGGAGDVGGTLGVAGELRLTGGPLRVRGDLRVGAGVTLGSDATVARDARVGGDVSGGGALAVAGDLTQPAGAARAAGVTVDGAIVEAPVDIEPPCPCDGAAVIDVASAIARARGDNDNATIDLSEAALMDVSGDTELELPCGDFLLSGVRSAAGSITIRAHEGARIFVDGAVQLSAVDLTIDPGDSGEVDLFVGGMFSLTAVTLTLGDPTRPAAVRTYVADDAVIALTGDSTLVGNLYAPGASLQTVGAVEVFGALLVRDVQAAAPLAVHYDRAVTELDEDCPPPPPGCEACGECTDGVACVAGECASAPCGDDGDCCPPLVCDAVDRRCVPLLI